MLVCDTQKTDEQLHMHRCAKIKVRSTGNAVVDRVRENLSFNDITVSQNKELMRKQLNDERTRANVTTFRDHLYDLITSTSTNVIQTDCSQVQDACINAKRESEAKPLESVAVDSTFFNKNAKDCLLLAVVKGMIDCKYWLRDGLDEDIAATKQLNNRVIKSAVRGRDLGWTVESDRMPDDRLPHTKEFGQVCALYTYGEGVHVQHTIALSNASGWRWHRWPTRCGCASCTCCRRGQPSQAGG